MKFFLRYNLVRHLVTVLLLLGAVNLSLHSLTHLNWDSESGAASSQFELTPDGHSDLDEALSGASHSCSVCQSLQHGQAIIEVTGLVFIDFLTPSGVDRSTTSLPSFSFSQPSDRAPPRL